MFRLVRCVLSLAVSVAACGSDSGAGDTGVDASADAGIDATISATLVSLVPSAGALNPSFESETLTYNLSVPPGSVSVAFTPVAEPATATIRVQGEVVASGASSEAIALTAIVTPVTVSVGDRDLVRTYTVVVTRSSTYVKASNPDAGDVFAGVALSSDGSTLAVGAPGEASAATGIDGDQTDNSAPVTGAVYVFVRSADGWAQQAYLKPSSTNSPFLAFGDELDLSSDGSTLAVAAQEEYSSATGIDGDETDTTASRAGAVYVFTRVGTTWMQDAYVKASNTGEDDRFGSSVALAADGRTLAVGATNEASGATGVNGNQADDSAPRAGAVYIFQRVGGIWSQDAYVKASNADGGDRFGSSVALAGDGLTLVVGAWGEDSSASEVDGEELDDAPDSGAAYVFTRAAGVWMQQAYLKPSNSRRDATFGVDLALSGDGSTLAVGASNESSGAIGVDGDATDSSARSAGAVYVFGRTAGTWTQEAYVKASNTDSADVFGARLSLSDDGATLVVSAALEASGATGVGGNQSDNGVRGAGAIYVFTRADTWTQQVYLKASNTEADDNFGQVALSGDGSTLAVGAPGEDSNASSVDGDQTDNTLSRAGAVYVFCPAYSAPTQAMMWDMWA